MENTHELFKTRDGHNSVIKNHAIQRDVILHVSLKDLAASGSWDVVRKLRKPPKACQVRLTNAIGVLVNSNERADTLALYMQDVQWSVRPCNLIEGRSPLWGELSVECGVIISDEIKKVVTKLKYKKACGPDVILPEHLKTLASTANGLNMLVDVCNICWFSHSTPESWKNSQVALLFKKTDPSSCANYRLISLLCVGYKMLASILLRRLKNGGAGSRVWST